MKTKNEITENWLPRYTGLKASEFSEFIILTNFNNYLEKFVEITEGYVIDKTKSMPCASGKGFTMINFGMGSPNAAPISDLLSSINPKAVLFLGKRGGLKKRTEIGDYIVPIGAIRGEGTSNSYFPPEVPSLPAFSVQRAASHVIRNRSKDYWTGTVYTTNRRVWEHDNAFKDYLEEIRAMAIDMETATLFSAAFKNHIPLGAILLVSDQPMVPEGVKTDESDKKVTSNYVNTHIEIGIETLEEIKNEGLSVRHLKF